MLARVGWRFAAAAAIYAVHVGIRAVALWRSLLDGPVRFADVLRIRLSGEAVEMLTFTGPFLAEPAKGVMLTKYGVAAGDAIRAIATEYAIYTVTSAWLAVLALSLLVSSGVLRVTADAMRVADLIRRPPREVPWQPVLRQVSRWAFATLPEPLRRQYGVRWNARRDAQLRASMRTLKVVRPLSPGTVPFKLSTGWPP